MLVHHLNCGTMCPPAARWLVNDEQRLVCHVLLIETDAGLVLVDTGIGARDCAEPERFPGLFHKLAKPRMDTTESALEQVRRLGYEPDDVRHIVVTHLDLDHAGGLRDFPRAQVHLHAAECFAATCGPTLTERVRYLRHQVDIGPRWRTYADAGDDWFGFSAVRQLAGMTDDIALVPLIGHTRGHSGVAVRVDDRWLLHAGDAYFSHSTLAERPRTPPGLAVFERIDDFDRAARERNQARLRGLAHSARGDVEIFCAHDPVELARYC